jgi:hypothetical protein
MKNLADLVVEYDFWFSKLVRLQAADENGWVRCYTCDAPMHWTEAHAGHYISRINLATRFSMINVHPQCPECNVWHGGNPMIYQQRLIDQYGVEDVSKLSQKSTIKLSRSDLTASIEATKKEVKKLMKDKI